MQEEYQVFNWQYLVRWKGYGPGDDEWMSRRDLEETIALDEWLKAKERC
jgi:hypothetical protein